MKTPFLHKDSLKTSELRMAIQKKYRVGIIGRTGKGNYGHDVDLAFTKIPQVEIVAVSDENEKGRLEAQKRLNAPRAYGDYTKMLESEKLDIVAVCPRWIDQHQDMILKAAEYGCHIYMEKPFCRTLEECDRAIHEMQMRHLQLGIAHISQYSPVLDKIVALIRGGEIGELLEIRGRGKEDQRGGAEDLWVLGSHIFGMMRKIASGNPQRCYATVWKAGKPVVSDDVYEGNEGLGLLAGDHIEARYDFASQVQGYFASKKGTAGKPTRFALQIMGSKGIIEIESGYLVPGYILRDSSWGPGRTGKSWEIITSAGIGKEEPRTDGTYQGGHIAAILDLIHCIEHQAQPRCSAEDGRAIIEMIAAVFESHRVQGHVDLPLKTRANPLSLLANAKKSPRG
ncbi:MAG: Gfo/Idh/MocA family oxidoreductase [Pirellulales bacterium]